MKFSSIVVWGLLFVIHSSSESDNPWKRNPPGTQLGIFVNTMVRIERKYQHPVEMWYHNRKYMDEETEGVIQIMCDESLKEDSKIGKWTNCSTNDHTLTSALHIEDPHMWDSNITHREVEIKPFKDDEGRSCIFTTKPRKLFYLSVVSILFRLSNNEFDEKPITKLDKFYPHALNFFKDLVDTSLIYNFETTDFIPAFRPDGYSCLLAIVEEESVDQIKKLCSFRCSSNIKEFNNKKDRKIEL